MKKRMIALCMAIVLILGLFPVSVMAEEGTGKSKYLAAFAQTVSVDGALDELAWSKHGTMTGQSGTRAFGILWSGSMVYFGIVPEPADTELRVKLGDAEITVTKDGVSGTAGAAAKWGTSAIELAVPYAVSRYSQTCAVELHMSDASWTGTLGFDSLERSFLPNLPTRSASSESVGYNVSADSYTMYRKYVEGVSSVANRVYLANYGVSEFASQTQASTIEFDFEASKMPATETGTWIDSYIACYGAVVDILDGATKDLVFGISNSSTGLVFNLNNNSDKSVQTVELHKGLHEKFHVRVDWSLEGTVELYIDDLLTGTFALTRQKALWSGSGTNTLMFNLCTASEAPAADGSEDYEVTVSNVRVGNTRGKSVLDTMTFADIAGENVSADEVFANLNLPKTWSNGQISNAALTWKSSDPSVITDEGVVTAAEVNKTITMTAALTADPTETKSFDVTVNQIPFTAYAAAKEITVDGSLDETAWILPQRFAVKQGETDPYAYFAWREQQAYIAVSGIGSANSLELQLGEKNWTVDLTGGAVSSNGLEAAVQNGTAEMKIDMSASGFALDDYNELRRVQIKLSGGDTAASLRSGTALLRFSTIGVKQIDMSKTGYIDGAVVTENSATFTPTDTKLDRAYYYLSASDVAHTDDLYVEQTLNITNMPAGGGLTGSASGNGYFFWVSYNKTGSAVCCVFSDAAGNLTLQIRPDGNKAGTWAKNFALNRKQGETFKLGLLWQPDDTASVYVDGCMVGSQAYVSTYNGGWHGNNTVCLLYQHTTASNVCVKVSNLSVTSMKAAYSSIAEELTVQNVLKGINLSSVSTDLNLPQTYQTAYLGNVALEWSSSNTGVLSNTGAVKQPSGVAATVELTLKVNGKTLWSVPVTVLPASALDDQTITVLDVPFTSDAVDVDGKAVEEGWNLNTKVLSGNTATGKFGAQWTTDTLYMAIKTAEEDIALNIGGKTISLDSAAKGDVTEIAIPLETLGISIQDYGVEIPAQITLGSGVWNGKLILTSTDLFISDTNSTRMDMNICGTQSLGSDTKTDNQGYAQTADGWYLFDHYDAGGNNPTRIRTYVITMGRKDRSAQAELVKAMAPLNDRTKASYAEFDFLATSMPVYSFSDVVNPTVHFASYGFGWALSSEWDSTTTMNSDSVVFGIINTERGLVLAAAGKDGTKAVDLGKTLGEQFRIGTRWETNGDVTIFMDGEKFVVLENMEVNRYALGSNFFAMNLIRSPEAAAKQEDSFDIYISNIALGKSYGDSVFSALTLEDILGENADANNVTSDVNLITSIYSEQLKMDIGGITWESSDSAVIDPTTGKVTPPSGSGKRVTITASFGGQKKSFTLYVKSSDYSGNVLYVLNDMAAASGAGIQGDLYFTLDENHNSIIFDQGESKKVNEIILKDEDEINRLNESVLTVWTSDDNQTYTQVDSFKILRTGKQTYLYDFEATARYIKVHCTHFDGTEADFKGSLNDMITVAYENVFGANGGEFTSRKNVIVKNTASYTCFDDAWTIAKSTAGVTGSDASIRVFCGSELLYHYTDGDNVVVRIPEIAANGAVTLTILSGNDDAMDISNKEFVYEVVYGTREAMVNSFETPRRWLITLNDGTIMAFDESARCYSTSTDGGKSWTATNAITVTDGWFSAAGGAVYDEATDRIIVMGFALGQYVVSDITKSDCKIRFIASDDRGQTWYRLEEVKPEEGHELPTYFLSYTDPVKVPSYDGTGNGVDYVVPCGAQYDNNGSFCTYVLYSKDAGLSWTIGKDAIIYSFADSGVSSAAEAGVSEATILPGVDGTGRAALVLYARCQYENSQNFVRTYSYDNGVTWTAPVEFSDVYTPNTQPIFHEMNGKQYLVWGGNNILGGNSYQRMPLNIAISKDGLQTFENIQDLYSRYSLMGLTEITANRVVNQSITDAGDSVLISWRNWSKNAAYNNVIMTMRVDDFEKYFNRTKGAYDSFENSNIKYEGWFSNGNVSVSSEQHSEGQKSMKLSASSSAVRSIPYTQDGKISMNIYLNDVNTANLSLDLASAYSNVYGKASPIGFQIRNGALTMLGADTAANVKLVQGWNTVVFTLNLATEAATLEVNGQEVEVPVNTVIGDYVCYVNISADSECYVDEFMVCSDSTAGADPAPQPEQYTLNLSTASESVKIGSTVYANVDVSAEPAVFATGKIQLAYDSSKLTFKEMASTLHGASVRNENGVLTIESTANTLHNPAYALAFEAVGTGDAAITITSAAFSMMQNAADADLIAANIQNGTLKVTISQDRVIVPVMPGAINSPTTSTSENLPFTDVSTRDWFYDDVKFVSEKGIMNGTSRNTFGPNLAITRGMIVTILYRMEGEPAITKDCPFTDVKSGSYYEKGVSWASENDIVSGYGNGMFGPNDEITREQLAAILFRYAQHKKFDVSAKTDLTGYADYNKVSTWASNALNWANANGLVNGAGRTSLNPKGYATRCQSAAILHRFYTLFVK